MSTVSMAELQQNCLAVQAVGSSMRSLLGPLSCLKFYIEESPDQSHDSGVLLEPMQVIEALSTVGGLQYGHPANHLLYESCRGQQNEFGCGVTTLVCLSAFWCDGVVKLVEEGIPLPVIFTLFEDGLQFCDSLFSSQAISLETLYKTVSLTSTSISSQSVQSRDLSIPPSRIRGSSFSKLKKYSRHLSTASRPPATSCDSHMIRREVLKLVSSRLAHGREQAMELASEAVKRVWSQRGGSLDTRSILTHCIVGKGQSSSSVMDGVLVDLKPEMISLCQRLSGELHVVVIEGNCTLTSTHPGLQRKSHMTSQDILYEQPTPSQWLSQCAAVLNKFCVSLVVVGGVTSLLLWEHCLAMGVVVLSGVAKKQRDAICRISGATPTYYLQHVKQSHIGEAVQVELVEGGWAIPRVVYKGTSERRPIKSYSCCVSGRRTECVVVTAMLCGNTETTVDLLCQSFQNSLQRLSCALTDDRVLPGGGVFEATCVRALRQAAANTDLSSSQPPSPASWMFESGLMNEWRPAVYEAVAGGLLGYVVTVVGNADLRMDPHMALSEAERMVCEDVRCEDVKVFDNVRSKRGAWMRAVQLLRTVCSVGIVTQ